MYSKNSDQMRSPHDFEGSKQRFGKTRCNFENQQIGFHNKTQLSIKKTLKPHIDSNMQIPKSSKFQVLSLSVEKPENPYGLNGNCLDVQRFRCT